MHFLAELDVSLYRALNNLCGTSGTLDRLVYYLAGLTGILLLGIFGLLWFRQDNDQLQRRQGLILFVPAVALALIANRVISTLLPFRVRPMYELGANAPSYPWRFDLENWSSFPSDNATYLFAITACLWAVSRGWGLIFGVFSTLIILGRVYFGIHYPSDVFAGALLGFAVGYATNRMATSASLTRVVLGYEKQMPAYFYGLLFMALAEVIGGFPNTRHVGVAVVHLFRDYEQPKGTRSEANTLHRDRLTNSKAQTLHRTEPAVNGLFDPHTITSGPNGVMIQRDSARSQ